MKYHLSFKNFMIYIYIYELILFYYISKYFTNIIFLIIILLTTILANNLILSKIIINFEIFKKLKNKKNILILLLSQKFLFIILLFSFKKDYFSNNLIKNYLKYFQILSIYHQLEFLAIIFFRINQIDRDSFVLYHSKYYQIAFLISNLEILTKFIFFFFIPFEKNILFFIIEKIGFVILSFGYFLRFLSFWTARNNFNHNIETEKRKEHILVKKGIYFYERHPSYIGFFLFAVGLQIYLCNFFTMILFSFILWNFFKVRIYYEEYFLQKFFGEEFLYFKFKIKSVFDKEIFLDSSNIYSLIRNT